MASGSNPSSPSIGYFMIYLVYLIDTARCYLGNCENEQKIENKRNLAAVKNKTFQIECNFIHLPDDPISKIELQLGNHQCDQKKRQMSIKVA